MCLILLLLKGAILAALYLDPRADLYSRVEHMFHESKLESSQFTKVITPPGMDEETYDDLFEMVELARPESFHPKHGWAEVGFYARWCVIDLDMCILEMTAYSKMMWCSITVLCDVFWIVFNLVMLHGRVF